MAQPPNFVFAQVGEPGNGGVIEAGLFEQSAGEFLARRQLRLSAAFFSTLYSAFFQTFLASRLHEAGLIAQRALAHESQPLRLFVAR